MPAKVAELTIGEHTFYIRRYDAFLSVEILGDLQRQFAGPLLGMIDGKQSASPEEANATMMAAFSKLSGTIDGKTLKALAERLINPDFVSVSIEGAPVRRLDKTAVNLCLDTAADVLQLCWEIVKHNYSEVIARFNTPFTPGDGFPTASP